MPLVELISTLLAALALAAPCEIDGIKADCGTLTVPENRSAPNRRSIDIAYAVVPATPGKRSPVALFVLAGGPGQAAHTLGGYVSRIVAGAGQDLVFADARGTGKSNALHCDFGGNENDLQGY